MKIESIIFYQITKEIKGTPTLNLSNTTIPINEDVDEFAKKIIKYKVPNPRLFSRRFRFISLPKIH